MSINTRAAIERYKRVVRFDGWAKVFPHFGPSDADFALLYILLGSIDAICEAIPEIEKEGDSFHKAFRQIDVTGLPGVDSAIHSLLNHDKQMFWKVLSEMFGDGDSLKFIP